MPRPSAQTLALFLILFAPFPISAQETLAIVGGTLIDGTSRPPIANAPLVIEGAAIRAVGPATSVTVPAGARVIRAEGKFVLHGATVRRELELIVAGGMTPLEALVAATGGAAQAIGQAERIGTLAPGKLADVIVVGGNVLEEIGDIRKLELVVRGGKMIEPRGLRFE